MEWKIIDSAPKDGTKMIGFGELDEIFIFSFSMGDWHECHVYGEIAYEITPLFWMPLPEPPKE
jgi:hypothetical protein